jgi:hypothetical protein
MMLLNEQSLLNSLEPITLILYFFIVKTYLPCFDIFMPKQRLARDVARTIYLVRSKCKLFYKYV